jgi:pectinesterase inhibitor-like protein
MSTAFSDFGPLTERRRVERQRQQRRRLMVATGGASIILILIVMGGAAVAYNASSQDNDDSSSSSPSPSGSGGGGGSGGSSLVSVSKSIKVMCAQTDYRDACEKILAKSVNASAASSPKDIVRAAVAAIGDAIESAFDRSGLIVSDNPRVKAAVADCKEVYGHARDDLARTLEGINVGGADGFTRGGHQLRVWLSAVIAHQETCIDGFPDGDIKAKMTGAMEDGKELTSNALAIIEKAASLLSAMRLASHRRLLLTTHDAAVWEGEIEEKPMVNHTLGGDPPLHRKERHLKGFRNAPKPNVVVAKDGSGQFKTINDALSAMPKKYAGRCVFISFFNERSVQHDADDAVSDVYSP